MKRSNRAADSEPTAAIARTAPARAGHSRSVSSSTIARSLRASRLLARPVAHTARNSAAVSSLPPQTPSI
ncbi:MAG: hypothetical protein ABSB15_17490 [Bryobacteraceae bacterium]